MSLWNLHLPSWVIQDGTLPDLFGGEVAVFAAEIETSSFAPTVGSPQANHQNSLSGPSPEQDPPVSPWRARPITAKTGVNATPMAVASVRERHLQIHRHRIDREQLNRLHLGRTRFVRRHLHLQRQGHGKATLNPPGACQCRCLCVVVGGSRLDDIAGPEAYEVRASSLIKNPHVAGHVTVAPIGPSGPEQGRRNRVRRQLRRAW